MNILPKVIVIGSLFTVFNSTLLWAEDDTYLDALSGEADKTSMKAVEENPVTGEKSTRNEEEPELKTRPEASDPNKLTESVSQQLEKLLVGRDNSEIKQEDLANIVSSAVQKGHEIDNIHDAVTSAMTELRAKEGIDIKAEVLEFSIKSVNEIVNASKDIAKGDVDDPYIQSLKAEAEVSDKEVTDSSTTSTDKTVSDSDSTETASSSTDKKNKKSVEEATTAEEHSGSETKTRTIIVLQGESLSKIAEKIYGSSRKYTLLYEANKETLKDPNNIRIGQIIKVPMLPQE